MTFTPRIGIRREDKSEWERRAPLTPEHVNALLGRGADLQVKVQPSERRVFDDEAYAKVGAVLDEDLSDCNVIFGVKEIPKDKLHNGGRYVFFSHTIKGQPYNMPMLARLLDLGCTLVDYELIKDEKGRRLIFFSRHAGFAGTIDTLWALGQRFVEEGYDTPLADVRMAHDYADLDDAKKHLKEIGERIQKQGFPEALGPVIVGFTGEGNVTAGAREVFELLPFERIEPERMSDLTSGQQPFDRHKFYQVLLPPAKTVDRVGGGDFDWDEYVQHPERYVANMRRWFDHLTALVHGIYWDERYPRLLTKKMAREMWAGASKPRLRVIGDISCDIEGSIELTVKATTPGNPVYVYDVDKQGAVDGVAGNGPVIMAVDNLPSELPVEASKHFGDSLLPFVEAMARCDWSRPFEELKLPREIHDAIICHAGSLTPSFAYLEEHLEGQRKAT